VSAFTSHPGLDARGGGQWVVADVAAPGNLPVGSTVGLEQVVFRQGATGLAQSSDGALVKVVRLMAGDETVEYLTSFVRQARDLPAPPDVILPEIGYDARTMPIKFRPVTGERHIAFDDAVSLLPEDEFLDFPVTGPRTVRWLCEQIVKSGAPPISRHSRWVREAEIPAGDRSKFEHEVLSKVLELGVCYDGLAVSNLASFEVVSRRLQLIEEAHLDSPGAPSYEAAAHYMGSTERRGGALISPGLSEHVAGRLRDEAAVLKEKRKAAEARGGRTLNPGGPAHPKPKKGGGPPPA
jgi:hypothetical protein